MGLSRDEILKWRDDLPTREVPVPEWGDGATVRIKCLTVGERLQFGLAAQKAQEEEQSGPNPTALLIALSAVDDTGKTLFTVQDTDALAEMRGDVVERLAAAVMDLSGLGDTADVDAEENSGATPSGGTPSESPVTLDAPSPS